MRRSAFTLIEVLVALVVGAIVLLGAHQVLSVVTDQSHALAARAAQTDRDANGERMLRDLVGQLELGSPGTVPFSGSPDSVQFSSWCETPSGWLERCVVILSFAADGDHEALRAQLGTSPPLDLVRDLHGGAFRYLESAAGGGQWFQKWGTGITAPLGIDVVLMRDDAVDTMLLRIGPRG